MNNMLDDYFSFESLHTVGVFQYNDINQFTLKSGNKSNFYCNFRILRSHPGILRSVVSRIYAYPFLDLFRKFHFDYIADVPTGATPIVSLLSSKSNIPMISPRKRKDYGLQNTIDGDLEIGNKVLLIDDVMTTGNSLKEYENILKEAGLVVVGSLIILNRSEEDMENIWSVWTMKDINNFYEKRDIKNKDII